MSIDLIRGVLAGLLFMIGWMLWNAWQVEHPELVPTSISATQSNNVSNLSHLPQQSSISATTAPTLSPVSVQKFPPVTIATDVLRLKVDPVGAALVDARLPLYPQSLADKSPFVLFNQSANNFYTSQSGLVGPQGPDGQQAALYQAASSQFTMKPDQNTLSVPFTWRNAAGLEVTKTYTFTRGSYLIQMNYHITNRSTQEWRGQFYAQLKRTDNVSNQHHNLFQMNPFVGGVLSSPSERYKKFTFNELTKNAIDQNIQNGWMAMEEHYFITAWVPDATQNYQYSSQTFDNNKLFAINMVGPVISVGSGQSAEVSAKLYVGPSIAKVLEKIAPGLDKTVDYGMLWYIGIILFWLLDHIHALVGNWGWSIVLLTLVVKLCFFQLSAKSFKSMVAMRKLQPQLQQIKERYGDDRAKVGQLTMELYKKEKVNPLSGCLPLLVQIPVFIALYWVLLESVQLRLAPFVLWIHDLAMPDPYYVLPVLMGLTMLIQQKMSPPPPDPMMAKMMMAMPVVFTFFFLNFPAGLVLYWVVSNTTSILQQWVITKRYTPKK